MNRQNITISIAGVIILLVTITISTLCIDDWSGLTGWAFATMLWSELLFFAGLVFVEWVAARTEQIITRTALYTLLSAYAIVNIPVSIIYLAFFKEAATSFIIVEVVLLAVVAIAVVATLTISKSVHQSNEKTMNSVVMVESLIERMNKLALTPNCEKYSSQLKKMSDSLRFTDTSVVVQEDTEIIDAISIIELEFSNE